MKGPNTKIILCIERLGVIKKAPVIMNTNAIKLKTRSKDRSSENCFRFSLSRENSRVAICVMPRSENIAIMETKEKAKVNFPYSVTPKNLTAKITKANPNKPFTTSATESHRVFFRTVCFIPKLLKRKSLIFT